MNSYLNGNLIIVGKVWLETLCKGFSNSVTKKHALITHTLTHLAQPAQKKLVHWVVEFMSCHHL